MNRVKRQFMQVSSFGALHTELTRINASKILDEEAPSAEAIAAAKHAAEAQTRWPVSIPKPSASAAIVNRYPYEVVLPLGTGTQQAALERLARLSAPYVVQNRNGQVRWAFDNANRCNLFGKAARTVFPAMFTA